MQVLASIFEVLTGAGQSFITFMGSLLNSIISIFGTTNTETGAFSFNLVGILTLVGVAISFVMFALRWITRLIKLRG